MKNYLEISGNVIAKGGLFGICAEQYINDEQYATLYIIELSEQCHVESVQRHWGADLVADILAFAKHYQSLKSNLNPTYE
jgi:hypothetical protein